MSTSKGVLATKRCWLVYLATATLLVLVLSVALLSSPCCSIQEMRRRHVSPRHFSQYPEDVSTTSTSSTSNAPMDAAAEAREETVPGSCVIANCTVTCANVDDVTSGVKSALNASRERNCTGLWKVNMTECRFPGDVLSLGWLPSAITKVGEIFLTRCSISTIADDAFQGPQFTNTSVLAVQTAAVPSLSAATLAPLSSSLARLELRDFRFLATVEDGALSQLLSLEELQLTQMPAASAALWTNATGGDNALGKVQTLDMSGNYVGELQAEFLSGVAWSAEQIFLTDAHVDSLVGAVFGDKFGTLKNLHLSGNNLTSIPEGAVNQGVYMFLERNPWDCSCPLEWVQRYQRQIMDSPACETPRELRYEKVLDLAVEELCGNGSSSGSTVTVRPSPPPSTTVATTTPPPSSPPEVTSVAPSSSTTQQQQTEPPTSSTCIQRTPKEEEEQEEDEEMAPSSGSDLSLTEVNSYAVRLRVGQRFLNGTLVWVTYDNGSLACFRYGPIRASSLVVDGLCPESSYAFCFSNGGGIQGRGLRGQQRFDPVDCVAHKTSALYENQSWIPNNKKNLVLGVGSASAFTTCVVIALGVYCALRRNPTLISKNVIVVKEFKDHILVMPKNYVPAADRKRPSQESSSTASTTTTTSTTTGVATVQQRQQHGDRRKQKKHQQPPVKPRIASPPLRTEPVVLKSARAAATTTGPSHNPTPRSSVSYVSVQEPTGAQKVGWRLRKAKHRIRTFFKGKPYNKLHNNAEIFLEAVQPKSSYTLV